MRLRSKRRSVLALLLVFVLALSGCSGAVAPQSPSPSATASTPENSPEPAKDGTVRVSTVDELLAAIAPDTEIVLESGTYNLSTAANYENESSKSRYYFWNQVYDGSELVIRDVKGLSITAENPESVTVMVEPFYANVLSFQDCDSLSLKNITIGHAETGYCTGGVVKLSDCDGSSIDNCRLYGCGTLGVDAMDCELLRVMDTEIYDCSYGAVNLQDSQDVLFDNCNMYDCEIVMDGLISVVGCQNCAFINSEIHNNKGTGLVHSYYSKGIEFQALDIHDNSVERVFSLYEYSPLVAGCAFKDNDVSGDWYGEINSGKKSVKAVDADGREISESELMEMNLAESAEWTTMPTEETTVGVAPTPSADRSVHVSTVDEFLAAIAPNTTIFLEAGTYDLSKAQGYGYASGGYYGWEENYDGPGLVIQDVDNLSIMADDATKVTIAALPRYADVISFRDCDELSLYGFTAGHTEEPGSCTGGVLSFEDCDDTTVISCALYGCGILGVSAYDCENMLIIATEIYDCSQGAVYFSDCEKVTMTGCDLHDNGGPDYVHFKCNDMIVDGKPMQNIY